MTVPPTSPALVTDSSALVALLSDAGAAGDWTTAAVAGSTLAAPELALFEAANVLRLQAGSGRLSATEATLAHADLLSLPLTLWPYAPLAERAWQLRDNLSLYDASYVALAELLGASLVTLDARLARAAGPRCTIHAFLPAPS